MLPYFLLYFSVRAAKCLASPDLPRKNCRDKNIQFLLKLDMVHIHRAVTGGKVFSIQLCTLSLLNTSSDLESFSYGLQLVVLKTIKVGETTFRGEDLYPSSC